MLFVLTILIARHTDDGSSVGSRAVIYDSRIRGAI